MAKKRFTDTEIWNKEWFMDLTPKLKCLIRYLFDNCDASGVWKPNWKLASLHIGEEVSIRDMDSLPDSQYEILAGEKIFLPDFINFQYGSLSELSPAHKPVFLAIFKNGLSDRVFNRVSNTLQEKDKDKEKDKDMEKDKEIKGGAGGNFLVQKMFSAFKAKNKQYPGSAELDYKPIYAIAKFLCGQAKVNGPPEKFIDKVLEAWEPISDWISKDHWYSQKPLSTIANGIQEIIQKILDGDKSAKKNGQQRSSDESFKQKLTGNLR